MRELSILESQHVIGALHIKLHFNVFQAIFSVIGAGILGGPIGAGVAVAAAIGAQGTGDLYDMITNEIENQG